MADEFDAGDSSQEPQRLPQVGLTQALWSFFSEMKTAIVLILLLAVVSILGTVIKQDGLPADYAPKTYGILKYLGLTHVYGSTIFKVLLALVGTNLTVCSINRFRSTWRRTFQQKATVGAEKIGKMPRAETMSCSSTVEDAAAKAAAALRSRSYHVMESRESDGVAILASKGRLGLWGPYLTHLSLLVIFLGAILGNLLGFGGFTSITEGSYADTYYRESTHREANLGFRVFLRDFEVEYDTGHNPTAYKSDLLVFEGDKLVTQKVIDVNHPLTYRGVSFFQSSYGLVMIVKITAPDGETRNVEFNLETENGPHGPVYSVSGEPFKQVRIGGKNFTVFVHDLLPGHGGKTDAATGSRPMKLAAKIMVNDRLPEYKGLDAWANLGWLAVGKSADFKGFAVTLGGVIDYTGLQVSSNPGLPVIYLGFGLLLAGVFLSFYVTHRIVRLQVGSSQSGATVAVGAMSREDTSVLDADFQRVRDALT